MIYYLFDLDDCIVIHPPNDKDMYNIKPDPTLQNLFNDIKYKSFIFTNGTYSHAELVLNKMELSNFKKIYARDTIPYMKPHIKSFDFVRKNILYQDYNKDFTNTFIFFEDTLENLKMAKNFGWITIWIHPNFIDKYHYNFVDYSFPNIYDALYKIKNLRFI
tara:strand:- start:414 stop:896 length:483 start_codon:yes stop_codon:yes gene_type:complete